MTTERDDTHAWGRFHWRAGIAFQRINDQNRDDAIEHGIPVPNHPVPVDGDVRMFIGPRDEQGFIIPAAEWASIVASVSAQGETAETYAAIQAFHESGVPA